MLTLHLICQDAMYGTVDRASAELTELDDQLHADDKRLSEVCIGHVR